MNKNVILLLIMGLYCASIFSQSFQWNSNYLAIGNVGANNYTLYNKSDNTIKVKLYNGKVYDNEYTILPQSHQSIIYPNITEFSKETFSNLELKVFYDLECYNNDLQFLNSIAQQRINRANDINNLKMFFRLLGTTMQLSDEWKSCGEKINIGVDVAETIESIAKNGLSPTIIDKIESKLKGGDVIDKTIDVTLKNKYLNTTAKNLKIMYEYGTNKLEVDVSDLQKNAYILSNLVSNTPLFTYTIDYNKSILPAIDLDSDGITNLSDRCPNLKGELKYKGCTKEYYAQLEKQKRISGRKDRKERRSFKFLNADFCGAYTNTFAKNEYAKSMYNLSFWGNLSIPVWQHRVGYSRGGALCLDGTLKTGFTLMDSKDMHISFDERINTAGLSYLFTFKRGKEDKFIIHPRIGITTDYAISNATWKHVSYPNQTVPNDAFIIRSKNILNQKLFYSDLIFRWSFPEYCTGIVFGARYQRNPQIIKNPNYNFDTFINNQDFLYPKSSLSYLFGVIVQF